MRQADALTKEYLSNNEIFALTVHDKNPQPRHSMITFKRVKEMFPHMEEIEYKTGINND